MLPSPPPATSTVPSSSSVAVWPCLDTVMLPVGECHDCWVIQFRAREAAAGAVSPHDERCSVGQQGRRVVQPCHRHAASGGECTGRRGVRLCVRDQGSVLATVSAGQQDRPIAEQCCCVALPAHRYIADCRECAGCRVVDFCTGHSDPSGSATGDEHRPVGQQSRGVRISCLNHAAGCRERSGGWVVQLRARKNLLGTAQKVVSTGDQHLAVGQQRSGVQHPLRGHAAGGGEAPRRGIVYFCARENLAEIGSASDKDRPVGQQRRGVVVSGHGHVAGRRETTKTAASTASAARSSDDEQQQQDRLHDAGELLLDEALQVQAARRVAQLEQGLGLNLADALARDIEVLAHFFQGVLRLLADAEAHA